MKTNLFVNRTTICMKSVILLCMALLLPPAIAGKGKNSQKKVISYVDTSLNGSQKYVLRVDDKPFYMTNVQVRFDKLRYRWNWDIATCERLIKETAALGFNTLSIPIHWVEVEPAKDKFALVRAEQRWTCTMAEARPIANSRLCDALSESR